MPCYKTSELGIRQTLSSGCHALSSHNNASIVVGAAHVIAALCADQLAVVAGETVSAVRADLAMMIHTRLVRDGYGNRAS
jgi:putative Ca2+/H+ antiporter (TMEM165/GDT1 family)